MACQLIFVCVFTQVVLRCSVHISKGEEFLGLFVHLMKGVNDDVLAWPFNGKIIVQIKNQVLLVF